ncbi:heterokaryon incompatibility protein-domain-containing protein [Pyrenochaeta sp. MPI-SDFR-AT-0127]|nr:heterokaryon incompatibility protein-domain-containing protein [Pyrenochaeta sp. MPI-SDFR-AT-0127]
MSSLTGIVYDEEGRETVESINRRMLGFLQVRLSEQEDWRARIFDKSKVPKLDPWQSKDDLDDGVPIRTSPEISRRVKSFIDAAVGAEHIPSRSTKGEKMQGSVGALSGTTCGQVPLYDGVPLMNARSIRVLELLPGSRDAPIKCLLKAVDLNSDPFYEALSYVWGVEDHETPIYVNETAVLVKKNLFEAIWNLRLDTSPRVIWIDSVCINQKDVIEKSCQVALMGDIYQSANIVVVFLGPESQDSRVLFDFLDTDPVFEKDSGYATTSSREEIAVAFWNVSQAPWWRRVWVLQEYSLAKNDPILQFGRRSILSSDFTKHNRNLGSNWALMYHKVQSQLQGAVDFRNANDYLQRSLHTLLLRPLSSGMWSLWLFAGALLHCGAADPRDRIYAIREVMGPVFKEVFPPDYTIPSDILFTRGTIWLLTMEKFGDAWAYFPPLKGTHEPSWALDFAHPFDHMRWEKGDLARISNRASRNENSDVSIFDRILVIDGFEFDKIHTVVEIHQNNIHGLVKKLWSFEKICSDFRESLNMESADIAKFASLQHSGRGASWKSVVEWISGIDDFPYWLLWNSYIDVGLEQPDWPGFTHIFKMSIYQEKSRTDLDFTDILNLVLCDFEQVQALVNQWKEFYPSHSTDFDEYLRHAIYLHNILLGCSPQGFNTMSAKDAPEGFHELSLEEVQAKARRLALEIDTAESGVSSAAKRKELAAYEDIMQKQMKLRSQIRSQQEIASDSATLTGFQMFRTVVDSELMRATMFITTKGFRGYGVCGTRDFEKGDKVCLLDGVAVPMVLRKVDDKHHRIVGAAHVEGIMQGEALVLEQDGLLKPTSFFIR